MIAIALLTVLARAEEPVVIDPSDVPENANVRYAAVTEVDMAGADVNAHVVGPPPARTGTSPGTGLRAGCSTRGIAMIALETTSPARPASLRETSEASTMDIASFWR